MSLPQTPEQRVKLASYVAEAVQYLNEVDTLKDDVANVKDIVVEEFDITKTEIGLIISAAYDRNKMEAEIDKRQNAVDAVSILAGDE